MLPAPAPCVQTIDTLRRMDWREVRGKQFYCARACLPLLDVSFASLLGLTTSSSLQLAQQVVNLGMILASALIIWKSLILFTASESPVVVVLRCAQAHRNALTGCAAG